MAHLIKPVRPSLRVALAQLAPTLGNLDANRQLHLDWIARAKEAKADFVIFPELSLTGYYLRDMVPDVAQSITGTTLTELGRAAAPMSLVLGFVEETPQFRYYNSAAFFADGQLQLVHRKVYLPTYGMFDEQRYFAAGERIRAFDTPFGRVGLLICEDFWHLSCGVILQAEEIDYLICISNSPGRGVSGEELGSAEAWRVLNRCYARFLGVIVIFVNRVGYEEGVNFWGGSEIIGPDGKVIVAGPEFDEALVVAEVKRAELRRERIGSPLARDEKLLLTIEELERIRRERFEF